MSDFMNEGQVAYFKEKLETEKQEILSRIENQSTNVVISDSNEMADEIDRAAMEEAHRLELNRIDHDKLHIKIIIKALRLIDSGDYGYCSNCGDEISIRRLQARPESQLCLECQSTKEFTDHNLYRR
ncbi:MULTISPECIES: TraR/DksA C4-type zinc finger protein [unclassified Moritella]|uniref:TraR/DksA family transcriptional regulator n=1 Tax=unclassified Moritella TaxID=2637987 RepID=UPI001BAD4A35|nr:MULTISPECIES: TraR/DksA C4-type zinc finger protein [unclassified Moritella]QUM83109.1 TraR/DksA C4-type zinc finger protein [Moritella sp. 28]QUM87402.1 TraR/DksA C4-type zinc finger protein [Moritella sp. 36]